MRPKQGNKRKTKTKHITRVYSKSGENKNKKLFLGRSFLPAIRLFASVGAVVWYHIQAWVYQVQSWVFVLLCNWYRYTLVAFTDLTLSTRTYRPLWRVFRILSSLLAIFFFFSFFNFFFFALLHFYIFTFYFYLITFLLFFSVLISSHFHTFSCCWLFVFFRCWAILLLTLTRSRGRVTAIKGRTCRGGR